MTASNAMKNNLANYISLKIDHLKGVKNQREIAKEIGYDHPNMISMFKYGEAKIPLVKVLLLV